MSDRAVLVGHVVVIEPDLLRWARWFEDNRSQRIVARTNLPGGVYVSTVFLGINHGWEGIDSRPLWFETMIFGGKENEFCQRYSTWHEAEVGHKAAVSRARSNRS